MNISGAGARTFTYAVISAVNKVNCFVYLVLHQVRITAALRLSEYPVQCQGCAAHDHHGLCSLPQCWD